ncbi:DUF2510 domain-containing protein [Nocardioides zeae]|uniref:DUF2510 domain-containing protein n=1 Tax=Nocardioides imazamoxiresistens TaxID=3231893 RepID=A0ABU3PWZ4_9ACTN|nr:DUF2510 domain-containing protein [Nocardioides zeae]MDT9593280.1 DUF2510 domain-containing protein [Nocardioides zeae]
MSTPPGWYDDGSGTTRWWDGERWSDAPPAGGPSAGQEAPAWQAGPAPYASAYGSEQPGQGFGGGSATGGAGGTGGGKGRLAAVLALVLVIVGAGGASLFFLLRGGDDAPTAEEEREEDRVQTAVEALWAVETCEDELALTTGERLEILESVVDQDSPYCDELTAFTYDLGVRDVVVEGDEATAVVEVTATYDGSEERYGDYERVVDLELEAVDGEWLASRRTIYSATPEGALEAYMEAATCQEALEVVTGTRYDKVQTAIDDDGSYCSWATETTYTIDVEDVTEDGDTAVVETSLVTEGGEGVQVPHDQTTGTAENTDLGWILEDTSSAASAAYQAAYDWYVATSCEARLEQSTGAMAAEVQAGIEAAAAGEFSICPALPDVTYVITAVSVEVYGGDATVVYDVEGTYNGTGPYQDYGERATVQLEESDDAWLVASGTATPA